MEAGGLIDIGGSEGAFPVGVKYWLISSLPLTDVKINESAFSPV